MEHPAEHPNANGAVVNPHAGSLKPQMGPQSHRRLALQERTHQLQSNSNKRKAGQLTLFGTRAFQPESDRVVCKARLSGRCVHRGHHQLCPNNRQTKGVVSKVTLEQNKIDKVLQKHFQTPLQASEKASAQYTTREAVEMFFTSRKMTDPMEKSIATEKSSAQNNNSIGTDNVMKGDDYCKAVTAMMKESSFLKDHSKSKAPLLCKRWQVLLLIR